MIDQGVGAMRAADEFFPSAVTPTMVITPGRIAYDGLLGCPSPRTFGALAIYIALNAPFTLTIGDRSRQSYYEVIDPYMSHSISSPDRRIMQILIEAETIGSDHLFRHLNSSASADIIEHVAARFAESHIGIIDCDEFDKLFFGRRLASRSIDWRIARVTKQIRNYPAERHSAETYAAQVDLSISRFTHLFREQTDTTLRRFCAWKRARGVMALVKDEESLVETALSAGFADSTHLSHSIRHFFGLRPKDIIAGSRELNLICKRPIAASPNWD